jgi:hypothetical protein
MARNLRAKMLHFCNTAGRVPLMLFLHVSKTGQNCGEIAKMLAPAAVPFRTQLSESSGKSR